jgi:hypothetical protein
MPHIYMPALQQDGEGEKQHGYAYLLALLISLIMFMLTFGELVAIPIPV